MAGINPKAKLQDRVRVISENEVRIQVTISQQEYELLLRVKALESQRTQSAVSLEDSLINSARSFIEQHDPRKKAERAVIRSLGKERRSVKGRRRSEVGSPEISEGKSISLAESISTATPNTSRERYSRVPLRAAEKHRTILKTGGTCTYIDKNRIRCTSDRWLQFHHMKPVSEGGGDEHENLTQLCWYHHDLVHQLELPLQDIQFYGEPTRAARNLSKPVRW